MIDNVESELFELAQPYSRITKALNEIPGIDEILAIGIIAEASTDMSHFPDERKFAAWAGVASGNNESGGKKKKSTMPKGQSPPQKDLNSSRQRG